MDSSFDSDLKLDLHKYLRIVDVIIVGGSHRQRRGTQDLLSVDGGLGAKGDKKRKSYSDIQGMLSVQILIVIHRMSCIFLEKVI